MKTDVLGIGFDNITKTEAVKKAVELISAGQGCYIVTPNPEIVWACRKNKMLKEAVEGASLTLADGIGIVKGAKILGTPLKDHIPGIEFASDLMQELSEKGARVFLFGAKPGIAEKAGEKLSKQFEGLEICGTADGYFKDDSAIIENIKRLSPDLTLVCLGSPKQELWMAEHEKELNTLMIGLGGSLDVFSGTVERAPEKFRKHGLEWFYRLCKEPRRIGRMMKLPLFLFAVIGQRISGKKR